MKTKIIVTFALCAVSAIASVAQGSDTATLKNYQKWQSRHTLQGYRWTVEAEYLFKHYTKNAFGDVNAFDSFICYDLPLKKAFKKGATWAHSS